MNLKIQHDKCIVYLDFGVGHEKVGRVVIELNKKIVPKSAENFRALCTGENKYGTLGKPLHFKDSFVHRVVPEFMIQCGDITNFDGTGGESIYGQYFQDENFTLKYDDDKGIVGMANTGKANTNNSQFFITTVPCTHLNNVYVAIGKVVKGFNIVKEISECKSENNRPLLDYRIINCGQFNDEDDWKIEEDDGTVDVYPPYPQDWDIAPQQLTVNQISDILNHIKQSGNFHFDRGIYFTAERKYNKAIRYLNWYENVTKNLTEEERKHLKAFCITSTLNLAAVKLKSKEYRHCLAMCDKVLLMDKDNVKGIFRQAQAHIALNDYELGMTCLEKAHSIRPNDPLIKWQLENLKKLMKNYLVKERELFSKMFS